MMKRLATALALFLAISTTPAYATPCEEADKAYEAGNYEKAKSILLPLSEAGNVKAINLIGMMHSQGKGYPSNRKTACDFYEIAAQSGYSSAQSNLSNCYYTGSGKEQNTDKAIFWNTKAAEQGDVDSQIMLAYLLADKNPDQAAFWGQKAVDSGSTLARVTMWTYDLPNNGLEASHMDIACVMLFNNLLSKPWNYCDYSD